MHYRTEALEPYRPFWSGETLPMSRSKSFRSESLDTVRNYMSSLFCDHSLRTEGGTPPVRFEHNHQRLKSLSFHATDYGMPFGRVAIDIPSVKDVCLVQISLAGSATIVTPGRTVEIRQGELYVMSSPLPIQQIFDHNYKHVTVRIPLAKITQILQQEFGTGKLTFEPGTAAVRLEGAAAAFGHLVRTICDDLDAGILAYRHDRAAEVVEDTLVRLFLASVPHNHSDVFNAPRTSAVPYYVRRVEKFVEQEAPIDEPITLERLVEVSGVRARTLHAGFRRFRSTTPMVYVKNHRLAQAHAMLEKGPETGATVTEVAMMCGFNHLSKFAQDYRDRFGKLPSETLKGFSTAELS